ncbi:hypothetical protein ABOONEI_1436 [Aciduliprofundum boonei T469]|nr:hypothetical protein ABOONEI_1436 [Aciduliprofundum boonei T469]
MAPFFKGLLGTRWWFLKTEFSLIKIPSTRKNSLGIFTIKSHKWLHHKGK